MRVMKRINCFRTISIGELESLKTLNFKRKYSRNPDILCNPKTMHVLDKGRYIHASQFGSDDQEVVQFVGTQVSMGHFVTGTFRD